MRFDYGDRYVRLSGPREWDWYTRQGLLLLDRDFSVVRPPRPSQSGSTRGSWWSGHRGDRPRRAARIPIRSAVDVDSSGVSTFVPMATVSNALVPTLFPHSLGLDWRLMGGVKGAIHALVWFDGMGTMEVIAGTVGQVTGAAAAAGATVSVPPLSFGLAPPVLLDTPGRKPQKNFMWLPLPGLDADPLFVFSFAPLVIIRCPIATGACSDVQRQSLEETGLPSSAKHWRGSSSFVPLPERIRFPQSSDSSATGATNGTIEIQFLGLVHWRVFHARYVHRFVLLSVQVPDPQAHAHDDAHTHAHAAGVGLSLTDRMAAALTSGDSLLSTPLIRVLGASDPFDLMDPSAQLPASMGGVFQVTFGMSLHLEQRPLHPDCGKLVLAFGRDDRQAWTIVMPLHMAMSSLRTFNRSAE